MVLCELFSRKPKYLEKERLEKESSLVDKDYLPENVVERKKKKVVINYQDVYSPIENFKDRNPMYKSSDAGKKPPEPKTPPPTPFKYKYTPPPPPFEYQSPRRKTFDLYGTRLHLGTGLRPEKQQVNHLKKIILGEMRAGNNHPQLKMSLKNLNNYLKSN